MLKENKGIKKTNINENKIVKRMSLVSIIGNVALSSFKMLAGFLGSSSAMISDAIHSLSDVLTTFIALIGVKISKKKADKSHPYGHERFECVASLFLGLLLLITGLGVGWSGIKAIISGEYKAFSKPGLIALIAAVLSILTKEGMFWYTRYYAKAISSSVFMADAWHHRSDALSSVGSLIGIGGAMLGFPIMDSLASIVICLFILKVAIKIIFDALKNMSDSSCDENYEKKLHDYILSINGVVSVDLLHTRLFGNKVYVDLEISVDGNMPLKEAHEIAEDVHSKCENNFPDIKHIMIHVNPAL